MNQTQKTVLGQTRKGRLVSVQQVAAKTGLTEQTARRNLDTLVDDKILVSELVQRTGERGRPAHLYTRAA